MTEEKIVKTVVIPRPKHTHVIHYKIVLLRTPLDYHYT